MPVSRKKPVRSASAVVHKVTVQIAGEQHVLRSEAPPEYTRAVAKHLDDTLRGMPGIASLEPHRAAILAALSITDELFRAREEIRRLRDETERRTAELADILEAAEAAAAEKRPVRRPAAPPGSTPTWTSDASGDAKPGDTSPSRVSEPAASPPGPAPAPPAEPPAEPDLLPAWIEDAVQRTSPASRIDADGDGEPELMLPPPEHHPVGGKEPSAEE
jgi:cell division protein ZapA